jgi:poly(A) polymerase
MTPAEATARLREAPWLRARDTQQILELLDGQRRRTRAVGGVVRDTLQMRARESSDIDLATELLPDEVALRAAQGGASVYPTGIEHGTVTVKLGGLTAEITTLREDIATDGRRAKVRFGTDWLRDAERRDFTINALYAGMDGALFDPLGGLADCLASRVRFIGDAEARIAEDRLRVYRFFRFSASHGGEAFDADGLAACRGWAGRLETISAERVGGEMKRLLGLARVARTLGTMSEAGILALGSVTLERLQTYERRSRRPEAAARLALIIAECGAEKLQSDWRLSNDEIAAAQRILAVADLVQDFRLNEAAYRFPAALADGVDVATAIAGWTEAGRAAVSEELQSLDVPHFPLSGADLLARGYPEGAALGRELDRLEQLWIETGFVMDRNALLAAITKPAVRGGG